MVVHNHIYLIMSARSSAARQLNTCIQLARVVTIPAFCLNICHGVPTFPHDEKAGWRLEAYSRSLQLPPPSYIYSPESLPRCLTCKYAFTLPHVQCLSTYISSVVHGTKQNQHLFIIYIPCWGHDQYMHIQILGNFMFVILINSKCALRLVCLQIY